MGLYLWRVDNIRKRRAVRYHDKYGPTALCIGLLAATIVNFAFRIREDGWFQKLDGNVVQVIGGLVDAGPANGSEL
jgi:hypothetical protein